LHLPAGGVRIEAALNFWVADPQRAKGFAACRQSRTGFSLSSFEFVQARQDAKREKIQN